jgi:hypothetical protein
LEAEDYGDVHSGFDGLAAERSGFIFPLTNGIRGCSFEERRARHLIDVLDVSVAIDNYVQLDCALDALALGVFGIDWFDARD